MEWFKLEDAAIPGTSGIKKAKIAGKTLCIIRDGEKFHATAARCPHAGADLSAGWCEEGRLICPYHRHAFDLDTGRGDAGQGNYINVYPLQQREDGWYVGVKKSWWKSIF